MTSKKIQYINEIPGNAYKAVIGERYAKAWREETGEYRLVAGTMGMPFDYDETHSTIEDLEKSMREFANLRHWVFDTWD